jgi:hypothetical protein
MSIHRRRNRRSSLRPLRRTPLTSGRLCTPRTPCTVPAPPTIRASDTLNFGDRAKAVEAEGEERIGRIVLEFDALIFVEHIRIEFQV